MLCPRLYSATLSSNCLFTLKDRWAIYRNLAFLNPAAFTSVDLLISVASSSKVSCYSLGKNEASYHHCTGSYCQNKAVKPCD